MGLRIYTKIQNFKTHTPLVLSGLTDFGDISSSTPSSSLLSLLPDKVDFTSISFSITITSAGSSCSSSKSLCWFSWKQPMNTVLLLGLWILSCCKGDTAFWVVKAGSEFPWKYYQLFKIMYLPWNWYKYTSLSPTYCALTPEYKSTITCFNNYL